MADFKGGESNDLRIMVLERERERKAQEFKEKQAALEGEANQKLVKAIKSQFVVKKANADEEFSAQTVGLVTAEQFRNKKQLIYDKYANEAEKARIEREEAEAQRKRKRLEQQKKRKPHLLGFSDDEEEEGGSGDMFVPVPLKKTKKAQQQTEGKEQTERHKIIKNPFVDTSFLPDRERELKEIEMREKLAKAWLDEQDKIKSTLIEVVFSFWDGSGHRRSLKVKKGTTIGDFLDTAKAQFREIRKLSADQLMFIKEDLIIPHHLSFYDLIENKVRGKTGPLFNFDVHDDMCIAVDTSMERDDSHAAKIVERHWYEQNKHIYPASRWEVFDPAVAASAQASGLAKWYNFTQII